MKPQSNFEREYAVPALAALKNVEQIYDDIALENTKKVMAAFKK